MNKIRVVTWIVLFHMLMACVLGTVWTELGGTHRIIMMSMMSSVVVVADWTIYLLLMEKK